MEAGVGPGLGFDLGVDSTVGDNLGAALGVGRENHHARTLLGALRQKLMDRRLDLPLIGTASLTPANVMSETIPSSLENRSSYKKASI
jgi:hypothetical protein